MFSLIITIVSIALVVALVAATMYHGGDTLTQGRTSADASAFVSGAQQVAAAAAMYNTVEGIMPADVAALTAGSKYLTSLPNVKGTELALNTTNRLVTSTVTADEVCSQINKNAGIKAADTADADDTDDALVVVEAELDDTSYGCVTSTKAFQFKF